MSPKVVIYWENDPISHPNLSIPLLNLFNCLNLTRVRYNAVALNLSPDPRVIAGPYSTDFLFRKSHVAISDGRSTIVSNLMGVFFRYNNKTYKIDDMDWDNGPMSTFKLHDGTETTYVEYYKKVSNH